MSGKLLPGDVISLYGFSLENKSLVLYDDLIYVEVLAITNSKAEDLDKIANFLHRDIKFFLGLEEKVDIRFALRADKNLSKKQEEQVLNFIDFVKKSKENGGKK